MNKTMKNYYLYKASRLAGPYSEAQIEKMTQSKEILEYSFMIDDQKQEWLMIDAMPNENPFKKTKETLLNRTLSGAFMFMKNPLIGAIQGMHSFGLEMLVDREQAKNVKIGGLQPNSVIKLNLVDETNEEYVTTDVTYQSSENHENGLLIKFGWLTKAVLTLLMMIASAEAAPTSSTPATTDATSETVDVSKITEKYWAQGKESELNVVQNRKFTNAHKLELRLFGGVISSDPFLSVHHYGASLGYHLDSIWSFHAIYWKDSVSASDALKAFEAQNNATTNTNQPKAFYGLETDVNLLYGKVSAMGKAIIYVDLFLLGGAGMTDTESGKNFTYFAGIGQKVHLNQYLAIHLDYRIMKYNEIILSKTAATKGQLVGSRANSTDAVTLGLSIEY